MLDDIYMAEHELKFTIPDELERLIGPERFSHYGRTALKAIKKEVEKDIELRVSSLYRQMFAAVDGSENFRLPPDEL